MALNLSRNTKVFVSSVNGVTAAGGNVLTVDASSGTNSGHAVGDIITFGTTSGSGTNFKAIVAAVSSGAASEFFIPNNFRGSGYADNDTVTSTASSGSGANPVTRSGSFSATAGSPVRVSVKMPYVGTGGGNYSNIYNQVAINTGSSGSGSRALSVNSGVPSSGTISFSDLYSSIGS